MNLNGLSIGEFGRVVSVDDAHPICQRLMAFGLLPGQVVELRQVAPLNDPIAIRFDGQQISLRRREAEFVEVEQMTEGQDTEKPVILGQGAVSVG